MFLSSVVYYFRYLLKSANMAFVQHKTGMENFTLREMRVGEMLMENRSASFFCRLLLWRFAKINKYGFCTAQNFHWSRICLPLISLPLVHTFEKERSLSKGTSQEEKLFVKTMKGNRP